MGRSVAEATNAFLIRMARCEGRRLCRALMREERPFVAFFAAEVLDDVALLDVFLVDVFLDAALDFVADGLAVEDAESELCAAESETVSNPAAAATRRRLRKPSEKYRGRRFIETL
jgi:hypothetical protein